MILSTASTDTPKAPCALGTVSAVKTEFHPNFRACREHKNEYFHQLLKESALIIVWVRAYLQQSGWFHSNCALKFTRCIGIIAREVLLLLLIVISIINGLRNRGAAPDDTTA